MPSASLWELNAFGRTHGEATHLGKLLYFGGDSNFRLFFYLFLWLFRGCFDTQTQCEGKGAFSFGVFLSHGLVERFLVPMVSVCFFASELEVVEKLGYFFESEFDWVFSSHDDSFFSVEK